MPDLAELRRVILGLERDLAARMHLRTLLAAANEGVAVRRQDIRTLKARIARGSAGAERHK